MNLSFKMAVFCFKYHHFWGVGEGVKITADDFCAYCIFKSEKIVITFSKKKFFYVFWDDYVLHKMRFLPVCYHNLLNFKYV